MAKHKYSKEICELDHAGDVPQRVLDGLPENQGHPVRHRCAACAYVAGTQDGQAETAKDPTQRDLGWACRLLLLTVAELHRRGFERLRIAPYMAPSGLYWRCCLVPRSATLARHGAQFEPNMSDAEDRARRTYSSSSVFEYFDWGDCRGCGPSDLADRFETSFADMLREARGADPAYVTWFRSMLHAIEPLGIVFAFDAERAPTDALYVEGECEAKRFPLPPPGDAIELPA